MARPAPELDRVEGTKYAFAGVMDSYLTNVSAQWVKVAPLANPGMLEMFRDRDRRPPRNLVPWAGEFAGKYLTGAAAVLRLTGDAELRQFLGEFVRQLAACQADDGYLGPWPREHRLTGWAPNVGDVGGNTWDAWGHYHVMMGLLLWHEDTGDRRALACARKIGDLLCRKFLGDKPVGRRLVDTGSTEMNLAPAHSLMLLHRRTGKADYLALARQIVEEFAATGPDGPIAGDYLRAPLTGKEFYQTPKPRWESLHPIMTLAELYRTTGDAQYREAFERTWWSIVKLDRHNNGGFSSGEQAQGNPYHRGAIETCCTIAWTAMTVEMLRMTGDSVIADELELTTLNSILGLTSASGRWVTYDTPMDGIRCASAHTIVFQSREGTPELNCCSVNGHRGLGMISDWALVRGRDDSLVLNYYGPSKLSAEIRPDLTVTLVQETTYPAAGNIRLRVTPTRAAEFTLKLRIPYWSARSSVTVNGAKVSPVVAGTHCELARRWKRGDVVEIRLDTSLHFWAGRRECDGLTSVYRGPLLLTYDRRFSDVDPDDLPTLDARTLTLRKVAAAGANAPILLADLSDSRGRKLRVCDFASAGEGGTPYRSWLNITAAPVARFSRANPLRSARP